VTALGKYQQSSYSRRTGFCLFFRSRIRGRSELLALRWFDFDPIFARLHVQWSMHQLRNGSIVYREPKTAHGRRSVALPPSAMLVLHNHRERQEQLRRKFGGELQDRDLIFCRYDGRPLLPNTVTHNWIKLVRRTSLPPIRLHDARHTHASLMLRQGIHPKVVQERLGHSSIQMTLDTYSHVVPSLHEAAAQCFHDVMLGVKHEIVEAVW
jgi:integrase